MKHLRRRPESGTVALQKGLSILSLFSWDQTELTLTEIAHSLSMPKSTVARITNSLEAQGFLERDKETKKFALGFKCYLLGIIAKKTGILRSTIVPYMEELREEFNETISLYLQEDLHRICYEQVECFHNLKRSARLGARFPLWAGAAGRCFLAFMPNEEVDAVLYEAKRLTENTILDRALFHEKLREVHIYGFSTSISEREVGVSSVAAPIFDASDSVPVCLSISGPSSRFTPEIVERMAKKLKEDCLAISVKFGASQNALAIFSNSSP